MQGGKISASKIDIQNWCGHAIGWNMTQVRGEITSKINIPALCVKCEQCSYGTCYCCAVHPRHNCYIVQSDCIKQCR